MEEYKKFYSQKAIAITTYFGGPLAAGILIRRNYLNLDKEKPGINALLIGVVATILLFAGIFFIPDDIIDKIPNAIIPLIYTGIIYLIVEKIQGKELKLHKENQGGFYSGWRAAGIGAISMLIIVAGIFGIIFLQPNNWDVDSYDTGLAKYDKNELAAIQLYDMLDTGSDQELINFINHTGIPKWKESIEILQGMEKIENLPEEFKKQDKLLIEYCQVRIKAYRLIEKSVMDNSPDYDAEIIKLHKRIDEIIEELQQ
jgi:hypothetical protein